jgi:hypothetical protein
MKLIIDCKEDNLEPEIIALAINLALNAGCAEQLCDYKHGKGLKLLFKRAYKHKDSLIMKMIRNISSHSSPDIKNQFIVRIKSSVTYPEIWRCGHTFFWARAQPGPEKSEKFGSRPDPGPSGPRHGIFSTNIQHPVCTWTYRDHGLTTYNWLSREKNRYTIISWCLFLSINAPNIKSCRLVEKSRTKVLYVDFSSIAFRF